MFSYEFLSQPSLAVDSTTNALEMDRQLHPNYQYLHDLEYLISHLCEPPLFLRPKQISAQGCI